MKNYLTEQRPSAPAACVPATAHESIVGRSGAWAPPMRRWLTAAVPTSGHRTSVSIARMIPTVPDNGVAVVNRQFTGDARGVPPRGRPV